MKTTNPTTSARNRYLLELSASLVGYIVLLYGALYAARHFSLNGSTLVLDMLLPVLPMIGVVVAVIRWLQATDEFERQLQITALAIAGAITMLYTVTMAFMENAGIAQPSMWYTYAIFMLSWAISRPIVARYYQ